MDRKNLGSSLYIVALIPLAEIRENLASGFHNELPSTLPAGMLSNGSFTEKRDRQRHAKLLSTIIETGKSWFLKVLTMINIPK